MKYIVHNFILFHVIPILVPQKCEEQEKLVESRADTTQPPVIQKRGDTTTSVINNNRTSSTLYQTALQSRLEMLKYKQM